jgi:hypothetical protein
MPLAAAIAGGLVAALFFLSVLTGSPGSLILVYLVQLPLYGVGLSLGVKTALIAGGAATLIAGSTVTLATSAADGLYSGAFFGCAEALPVAILVARAMRWTPAGERRAWPGAGDLTIALVVLGGALLSLAALVLMAEPEGYRGMVHGFLEGELRLLIENAGLPANESASRAAELAEVATPLFPGMAACSWLFMTMINGVLAQGALARFERNRRPSPDIADLRLPRWLALPLAGAAVLAVAATGDLAYFGVNLLPVLGIAYALAGLAVLHATLRRRSDRLYMLVPAYLSLLLGWPILLLATCGIIDQWFGLRSRIAAAAPR